MDEQRPIPAGIWFLYAIMSAPLLVPLMIVMVEVPLFGAVVSTAAGARLIFGVVRWMNLRHVKRPPNAP